jgi:tetratricopeptide (TPR) repeat protein
MRAEAFREHPGRDVVARFLRGEASREEAREVVRHLVSGCTDCRRTVGAGWGREAPNLPSPALAVPEPRHARRLAPNVLLFGERRPQPADYQTAFERVLHSLAAREREFAAERREVPALKARLDEMAPAERVAAVRGDAGFRNWALVEALIDDSREAGVSDAVRAFEIAELAVAGSEVLDAERYSAAAVADLGARAWANRGNALRILGRFADGRLALDRAEDLLARGSGDPAERCRVLMMRATLDSAQKRFAEADALIDRAVRLAARAGDRHLQGSAVVRKARIAQKREDAEAALDLLRRGLALIDPEQDPRLLLVAQHNLVLLMVETGRYREALERMEETRALHLQLGGRIDFLRFRWVEGRTYAGLGWLRQAAAHFEDARRGFIAEGLAYDVALVSLDLAAVYAQEGRDAEVRGLAEEMLPIFRSAEAHQEALAALLVFHDAARREAATVGLIHRVADYLRRARGNPELAFHPAPEPS